jgi:hypothetical protein
MNILTELVKIKRKHSYFYAEQESNEFPFSLDVDLNNPLYQVDYDPAYTPLTNVHIDGKKMLLNITHLLNEYYKNYYGKTGKEPLLLCIGSAPGTHLTYLHEMYPKMKFVLYDRSNFNKKLLNYKDPNGFPIFDIYEGESGNFTDEKANLIVTSELYKNYDLLIVSSIRTSASTTDKFEDTIENDMKLQQSWMRILNPVMSLVKFRMPINMKDNDKLTYMSGKLIHGAWKHPKTNETYLLSNQLDISIDSMYDYSSYNRTTFFHNKFVRPFSFRRALQDFPIQITDKNLYCPCYDCYAELNILNDFLNNTNKTGSSIDTLVKIISNIYSEFEEKMWSKTWDDNISIEKQLNTEQGEILGVSIKVPVKTNNVLIVIPKVNIYNLENFESMFIEYLDDFNNIIKDVKIDNMAYYSVVVLEQLPYKEHTYFGALMNIAFTIAKFSNVIYDRILFHEPFLKPNRKLMELYVADTITDNIVSYSNIYKSVNKFSVFSIKTDTFQLINGFPNTIWDTQVCYAILLDRIHQSGKDIFYVNVNQIDYNSSFFNINYEDQIADVRTDLETRYTNRELQMIKDIRDKSNYDIWSGVAQKYYFNTVDIRKYIDSVGQQTDIKRYIVNLHDSCSIYMDMDSVTTELKDNSVEEVGRMIMDFIRIRLEKYLSKEKIQIIEDMSLLIEHLTDNNYIGINMCYGEFIENIINVMEEAFLYVQILDTTNKDLGNVIKMILSKWYSYINVQFDTTNANVKSFKISLSRIDRLDEMADYNKTLFNITKIYKYSQETMTKYLLRTLFYDYHESTKDILKFMLEYQSHTYLNMIIHNLNILEVEKQLNQFENIIKLS